MSALRVGDTVTVGPLCTIAAWRGKPARVVEVQASRFITVRLPSGKLWTTIPDLVEAPA